MQHLSDFRQQVFHRLVTGPQLQCFEIVQLCGECVVHFAGFQGGSPGMTLQCGDPNLLTEC